MWGSPFSLQWVNQPFESLKFYCIFFLFLNKYQKVLIADMLRLPNFENGWRKTTLLLPGDFPVKSLEILKNPPCSNLFGKARTSVFFKSLGKPFFAWRFILNENILFWLAISYQKPFVLSVSTFCSQIFNLKLNLRPNWSDLCNFYSKVTFWFLPKQTFTFLCWIWITRVVQKILSLIGFLCFIPGIF